MSLVDHQGKSEFPFSKDAVFDAVCRAIPTIKGMKLDNFDRLQGRIIAKGGVSAFSWGESISIQLIEISENKTSILITSSPKTGLALGGAMDMGKNKKNIEEILFATSRILSNSSRSSVVNTAQSPSSNTPGGSSSYSTLQPITKSNAWYDNVPVVIVLCIFVFPVGLYALWKNSKIHKGLKIGITILIGIIFIAAISSGGSSSTSGVGSSKAEKWTTVYTFSGSGMRKSPVFSLEGGDARLKYSYQALGDIGMGAFGVFLLDEGQDVMKTGGIPEVMITTAHEESETMVHKGSGRYYLYVTASGNWTVTVEELK